jgi:hypothetical protein
MGRYISIVPAVSYCIRVLRTSCTNHPPPLLPAKQTLSLLQRMNEHRHTTRLEIRRLAHLVEIVCELGGDFAKVDGAELFTGCWGGFGN